jgi:Icc-related predicted phosphoesterase
MARLLLLSDVHQEFTRDHPRIAWAQRFAMPSPLPADIDIVVVAGDVNVPAERSLEWIAKNFSGFPTIYVLGNHDFYQFAEELEAGRSMRTYLEILEDARLCAKDLGIHLLENDVIELAGIRFIGCTLWTDFRLVGPAAMHEKIALARGRFGMNDYRRIKRASVKDPSKRRNFRPIDSIGEHIRSRNFIRATLRQPFPGPTVVVSHHAPHPHSLQGADNRGLDHCYVSDLSEILLAPNAPDAWLHGHIHKTSDYRIGKVRIVANPMGYLFDDRHSSDFNPNFIVEV